MHLTSYLTEGLRGGHLSLPTQKTDLFTLLEAVVSVLVAVVEALDAVGVSGWRREVAQVLAESLDGESPNASMAKELQVLMVELTGSGVDKKQGDVSDDLASKRAVRRASGS